jgi:cell division protein FtsB
MDQLGPDRKDPEPDPDPTSSQATTPPETPPASHAASDVEATQAYATPLDTDAAVHTEAVEPPPVHAFVPEQSRGPRRVGGRLSAVLAVVGVLAIGGAAALGYSLNQDLTTTRATLASTEGDLGATKTTLAHTNTTLDATNTTLAGATEERTKLDSQVADLEAQVSTQTECVGLQTAALEELVGITELQRINNNRTKEGSTWAKSDAKRANAAGDALSSYYQAYSKSFDRALASARSWAAKGKEAVGVVAVQAKQQLAEFDLIDRSATEIEAAIKALEQQLKTTEATCAEVGS